jgi:hypothetical protein
MNLSAKFELVDRPLTHYVFLEKHGPFAEVAPPLWNDLMPLLGKLDQQQVRECLGLSGIDKSRTGEDTMIYQAGVASPKSRASSQTGSTTGPSKPVNMLASC